MNDFLGIQTPRVASNGLALPSARLVSTVVFGGNDVPIATTTLALMQFGQFINHDFQSTAQFTFCKINRKIINFKQTKFKFYILNDSEWNGH